MDVDVEKSNINIVVLGHAKSGKSTTVGHLIYECGLLDKRTIEKFEREAVDESKDSTKFIWVLDKLKKELRGTTDKPYCKFETTKQFFTVIETPGHNDFIKNLATGARADCALLVVSAKDEEFEKDITFNGVIREHLLMAHFFGISQLIVCINKMDTVKPSVCKLRFEEIKKKLSSYVDLIDLKSETVAFVPINSWNGDNLFKICPDMVWHENWVVRKGEEITHGITLIEALDNIDPAKRPTDNPLRLPLSKIFSIERTGIVFAGRVESGILKCGNNVTFSSSNKNGKIISIEKNHMSMKEAFPGDAIGFKVRDISAMDIYRGDVCGDSNNDPPKIVKEFKAHVFMLNKSQNIYAGDTVLVECHTAKVICVFSELLEKIDQRTGLVTEVKPQDLSPRDSAIVNIIPKNPICVEQFSKYPALGRFAVNISGEIVAFGIIKSVRKVGDDTLEVVSRGLNEIPSWDEASDVLENIGDDLKKSKLVESAKDWPAITSQDLISLAEMFLMNFGAQIKGITKLVPVLLKAKDIYTALMKLAENVMMLFSEFLERSDFGELLHIKDDMKYLIETIERKKKVMYTYRNLLSIMKLTPGCLIINQLEEVSAEVSLGDVQPIINTIICDVMELQTLEGQENVHNFVKGKGFQIHQVSNVINRILDLETSLTGANVVFEKTKEITGSFINIIDTINEAIKLDPPAE